MLSPLGLPLGDSPPPHPSTLCQAQAQAGGEGEAGGEGGHEGGEEGEADKYCVHRREKQPLGCFDSRFKIK